MENKLVLIDGNSILNRTFYGVPDLTNREGRSVYKCDLRIFKYFI